MKTYYGHSGRTQPTATDGVTGRIIVSHNDRTHQTVQPESTK
jgi:hypothetical protein